MACTNGRPNGSKASEETNEDEKPTEEKSEEEDWTYKRLSQLPNAFKAESVRIEERPYLGKEGGLKGQVLMKHVAAIKARKVGRLFGARKDELFWREGNNLILERLKALNGFSKVEPFYFDWRDPRGHPPGFPYNSLPAMLFFIFKDLPDMALAVPRMLVPSDMHWKINEIFQFHGKRRPFKKARRPELDGSAQTALSPTTAQAETERSATPDTSVGAFQPSTAVPLRAATPAGATKEPEAGQEPIRPLVGVRAVLEALGEPNIPQEDAACKKRVERLRKAGRLDSYESAGAIIKCGREWNVYPDRVEKVKLSPRGTRPSSQPQ